MAKRILVTGMSGLGRGALFGHPSVKEAAVVHDLGYCMREIARERQLPFSDSNILRASQGTLAALRAAALERILHGVPADGDRPVIISAHSLFLLTDGMSEGLSPADIETINPDLIITLIDAPQHIHVRLREHQGEYFRLTIESIIRWQEFEVFFAHHIAKERGIGHFVAPVGQPDTFLCLVRGDPRPIVYASYPMTHLADDKKPLVKEFVRKLQERCIVFDPSSIESTHGNKPYYSVQDYRAIRAHTIVRDLDWFIGINSQAVVAYWPALVFSSGMNDELRYAYENGRDTYLVAEVLEDGKVPTLSPFTTYKNRVFWSSQDFFDYLEMPANQQDAYRLMQGEMIDVLHTVKTTGVLVTADEYRRRCVAALHNAKPDAWVAAEQETIDLLAERIYDRWAVAMQAVAQQPG